MPILELDVSDLKWFAWGSDHLMIGVGYEKSLDMKKMCISCPLILAKQ